MERSTDQVAVDDPEDGYTSVILDNHVSRARSETGTYVGADPRIAAPFGVLGKENADDIVDDINASLRYDIYCTTETCRIVATYEPTNLSWQVRQGLKGSGKRRPVFVFDWNRDAHVVESFPTYQEAQAYLEEHGEVLPKRIRSQRSGVASTPQAEQPMRSIRLRPRIPGSREIWF